MKNKFNLLGIVGVIILLLVLSACGKDNEEGSETEVKTIKVTNYFGEDHPHNVALKEKFIPYLEEKTNGNLKVDIYPNSQLGGEEEFYNGVRDGSIEMAITGNGPMLSEFPKVGTVDLPYLFENLDHFKNLIDSPITEELTEGVESKHGLKILGWGISGLRIISANQPIESMEDFKGFRLRMSDFKTYQDLGKALGTNVTPMPMDEVFTSLEQDVIDGQDNPIATVRANGWYEVQDYILESGHMTTPNIYIMNNEFFENLSSDEQKIVEEAVKITSDYQWDLYLNSFDDDKAFLEDEGVKFITPDEDFLQDMKDSTEYLYDQFYDENSWGKELTEKIKSLAD